MRLIIIPEDSMISIDGKIINECDMSWIPEFVGNYTGVSQKVHALQWFGDHGEIELKSHDLAIPITELGIFEQAVTAHAERIAAIKAEELAAKDPVVDDQEAQKELLYGTTDIDIDQLLAELENEIDDENVETPVPPAPVEAPVPPAPVEAPVKD